MKEKEANLAGPSKLPTIFLLTKQWISDDMFALIIGIWLDNFLLLKGIS